MRGVPRSLIQLSVGAKGPGKSATAASVNIQKNKITDKPPMVARGSLKEPDAMIPTI